MGNKIVAEASSIKIPNVVLNYIYKPYIKKLISIKNKLIGYDEHQTKIVFKRNTLRVVLSFLKRHFKKFNSIRKIYFYLKIKRYNRPKGIGSNI